MSQEEKTAKIRQLNDDFRKTFQGGRVVKTPGVDALSHLKQAALFMLVNNFDTFTEDNDPHKEHDFGAINFFGTKYYWKIDYYGQTLEEGSEDPSDPKATTRVLTIMRASEY